MLVCLADCWRLEVLVSGTWSLPKQTRLGTCACRRCVRTCACTRAPERVAAKCRRVPAKTNRLNEKQLLGQRERGRDGGEQARPNTLTPLSLSHGLKGDTVPLCPIAPTITFTTLTPLTPPSCPQPPPTPSPPSIHCRGEREGGEMPLRDADDAKNKATLCLERGEAVPNNDGIPEHSHGLKQTKKKSPVFISLKTFKNLWMVTPHR